MVIVYIDYQNFFVWFMKLWYSLLRDRIFVYLKDKYKAQHIKIFLWYQEKYKSLYENLPNIWYELIFRESVIGSLGREKANVDTDIVLESSRDYYERGLQK